MSGMTQSKWRWCWQFSAHLLVMGGAITLRSPSLGIARSDFPRECLGSCMKRCSPLFWLGGGISIFCLVTSSPVQAQIVSDGTVGTIVNNPSGNIFEITGGTPAGSNLFHSFDQFSVPNGDVVRFINNLNIQNVISRVTGQGPAYISNINGVIAVGGTAPNFNLFLLNPNGILFGPNAQLNIGGSFVATTANAIQFGNQGTFIASTSQNDVSLLTVNPSALFFNQLAAQPITNRSVADHLNPSVAPGVGLRVPDGKNLLLIGGNVTLEGGHLIAPGGRVELGGVVGEGTIGLSVDGNNLRLESFPDSVARAEVSLSNGAEVNVRAGDGGSIAITAQKLTLAGKNRSSLQAGIAENLGSVNALAGDIDINVTRAIILEDASFISNSVRPGGSGKSGNINITTGSLSATDGAQIYASTSGQGNAGNITIQARERISFDGQSGPSRSSGAVSEVESTGVGKGSSITITTPSLSITNGGTVTTGTAGKGNAGRVIINANTVSIDGQGSDPDPSQNGKFFSSGIYSRIEDGEGNPGSITIITGLLSITKGGIVTTSTAGKGNAGSVTINADQIIFDGEGNPSQSGFRQSSGAFSAVREGAEGDAGNIDITAGSLSLTDGAIVTVITLGRGNGGTVNIKADTVSFDGQGSDLYSSGAYSSVGDPTVTSRAVGNGGGIIITTGSLSITKGAQVNASTFGEGEAGNIQVNAANSITLSGVGLNGVSSGIFTSTEQGAIGKGGEINVNTNTLEVKDGAVVNARTLNNSDGGSVTIKANTIEATNGGQVITTTRSDGRAGNITINDADSIILSGSDATFTNRFAQFGQNVVNEDAASGLFANTRSSGNAGDLKVFTGQLVIQDGAQVSAYTLGTGQAGTLAVQADLVEVSGISADGQNPSQLFFDSSGTGNAGELTINTNRLVVQNGGRVSAATSGEGKGGILSVDASDSVLVNGTNGQFASGLYFDSRSTGDARGISIKTGLLEIQNGGEVTVSGRGTGSAGDLQITADSIFVNNQGTLQATNASGAGSIRINTGQLTVQNGSQVTVSGSGSGVSGDLEVKANSIFLANQGNLTARTNSGEGGNIRLQVGDTVWLRQQSNILTEATNIGNGGNITIDAGGFVLAILSENSDVAATAIQGRGGNIFVTAQGVFGFSLPERLARTSESDISAASQLGINGTREINTPANPQTDALPDNFLDDTIDTSCPAVGRREGRSSFVVTGRGGLPDSPESSLRSEAVEVGLVAPAPPTESRAESHSSSPTVSTNSPNAKPKRLVEAQGWVIDAEGRVVLVAQAPTLAPYSPWIPTTSCQTLKIR